MRILGGRVLLTKGDLPNNLRGFGVVSGSNPVYSIINIATASGIYALFQYLLAGKGVYYGPLSLSTAVLCGGMVGPMAGITMFFAVYCSLVFRGPQFYDLCAPDRSGGFKKLGLLITWADLMTFVAAIGVPIVSLAEAPKTISQLSLNIGMTLFIIFCILSFYGIPLLFLHSSMRFALSSHRETLFRESCREGSILFSGTEIRSMDKDSVLAFLAKSELLSYATRDSDWPVDYAMFSRIVLGVLGFASSQNLGAYAGLIRYLANLISPG